LASLSMDSWLPCSHFGKFVCWQLTLILASLSIDSWLPCSHFGRQACQNESMGANCQQTNLPKWEHGSQLSIDKLAKMRAWEPTVNRQTCQNESMGANWQACLLTVGSHALILASLSIDSWLPCFHFLWTHLFGN
jgi:hypothetical protein